MTTKRLIEFPCDYPIKIIGRASADFDTRIITIINRYQDKPYDGHLVQKDSKQKNYISLTVIIRATSEAQLKTLFEALKQDEDVIIVL